MEQHVLDRMPRFVPLIRARRIFHVVFERDRYNQVDRTSPAAIWLESESFPVMVDAVWVAKNNPDAGGWLLVEAGEMRYCSASDFEKQYRAVDSPRKEWL